MLSKQNKLRNRTKYMIKWIVVGINQKVSDVFISQFIFIYSLVRNFHVSYTSNFFLYINPSLVLSLTYIITNARDPNINWPTIQYLPHNSIHPTAFDILRCQVTLTLSQVLLTVQSFYKSNQNRGIAHCEGTVERNMNRTVVEHEIPQKTCT